jgi:hypothetical protein
MFHATPQRRYVMLLEFYEIFLSVRCVVAPLREARIFSLLRRSVAARDHRFYLGNKN